MVSAAAAIDKQYDAHLCPTNQDVFDIVTRSVLDELAAHPHQQSIAVTQNDWGHKCTCDRCEAIDRRKESDADSAALMNEFLQLHYGATGPRNQDYPDELHAAARDKGLQHAWVGHARHYGIDPALARQGSLMLEQAIANALNATLRTRLGKASIGTHMAALGEAFLWIWPPGDDPLPLDVAHRTRPYFRQDFELCRKYGITHWEEACTNETIRPYLKVGFGLKPDEPW